MTSIPHRLSACHRHPHLPLTGFCASCLRDRLALFHSPPSPHHRRTTSLPSICGDATEPSRRRSCDVRPRNSLSDLLDDGRRGRRNRKPEIEEAVRVRDEETKTMKEFIDLELRIRKKNAGRDWRSFRDAACAFGEKLRNWKGKHKSNQNRNGNGSSAEKRRKARRLRETQSEIGEYGLGRRSSCDDTAPRCSMDWPRASWDGCLIGKACSCARSCQCPCSRLSPEEDANVRVMVEEISDNVNMGESIEESKQVSKAKVSPTTTDRELFHGAKLVVDEKELKDLRDSNNVEESSSGGVGSSSSNVANAVRVRVGGKGFSKWGVVWNKLGLVQRREDDKMREGECVVVGDLFNEPVKMRRVVNVRRRKLIRSYRKPCRMAGNGLVNGSGDAETQGNVLNGRQEVVLRRNRSVGYSRNSLDNGLLKFYLARLKSCRKS